MKWTEVWEKQFRYDGYSYIWSGNDVMVFTVDMERDPESKFIENLMNDMLTVLNGGEVENKYEGLEVKDGCDLYCDGIIIGSFRGWGHLTGSGALGLSEKEAIAIQDAMINFVLNKLTKGE